MASVRDLNISKLTVKKLTQLAKKRGLKGYSKLNKVVLVRLLESQENTLDQPVPGINVPVLTPQTSSRYSVLRNTRLTKGKSLKNMQITNGIVLLTGY